VVLKKKSTSSEVNGSGQIHCWGDTKMGMIEIPDAILERGGVISSAAGVEHSCAVSENKNGD